MFSTFREIILSTLWLCASLDSSKTPSPYVITLCQWRIHDRKTGAPISNIYHSMFVVLSSLKLQDSESTVDKLIFPRYTCLCRARTRLYFPPDLRWHVSREQVVMCVTHHSDAHFRLVHIHSWSCSVRPVCEETSMYVRTTY